MDKKVLRYMLGAIWFVVAILFLIAGDYLWSVFSMIIGALFVLAVRQKPKKDESDEDEK